MNKNKMPKPAHKITKHNQQQPNKKYRIINWSMHTHEKNIYSIQAPNIFIQCENNVCVSVAEMFTAENDFGVFDKAVCSSKDKMWTREKKTKTIWTR